MVARLPGTSGIPNDTARGGYAPRSIGYRDSFAVRRGSYALKFGEI
jgi:hypothetical protein